MRKIRLFAASLAVGAIAVAPSAVAGQTEALSFEGRFGTTLPVGELRDMGAEGGLSLGADVLYTVRPSLTLYGGYGWEGLSSESGPGNDISGSGFDLGLKVLLPRPGSATPWARGGLLLYETQVGEIDSDRTLGFEGAIGIDLELTDQFSLVPSAVFRQYTPDFEIAGIEFPAVDGMNMNYFMLGLAAHLHL